MDLKQVLSNIGLDEKETATYMAVLELGTSSVYSIAKKAELKRPTVYRLLDQLGQKGLVTIVPRVKKQLYTANSPEHIVSELQRKAEVMKNYLPQFLAIFNSKKDKPQVQLFEGKEAVRQVYQKCISLNKVWFFGSVSEMFDTEEFKLFLKRVKAGELKARDLFVSSEKDLGFARSQKPQANYEIKFLPEQTENPITDFAVFGDNLVFFSFRPTKFAVLITSKEVAGTFRLLYESAWSGAKNVGHMK